VTAGTDSAVLLGLRRTADRVRVHARRPVARTPYLWDLAMRVRPEKYATVVRPGTAIVIEGFMRSGNTFSVAAFEIANGPVHIGRHMHGAPHVLRAARMGVPAIVLIRPPRDAVLSYVVRRDTLTPHHALVEYLDFYRTAWPARGGFVVGLFDRVVSDFGGVIEDVNAHFGTSFRRFEHTPENEARAFQLVEEMDRRESGGDLRESHVGRPSHERAARKEELRALLDRPRTAAKLREAQMLYDRYAELAAGRSR
jgi:hypothetical protein